MTLTPALLAVGLYSALLTVVFLWVTVHVGLVRGREKVSIGDGGNAALIRAMRGQANFVENVPLTLLLLLLMALIGTPVWVVHIFGVALLVGRVLHGSHFAASDAPGWTRGVGTTVTMLVQLLAALGLLGHVLFAMMGSTV